MKIDNIDLNKEVLIVAEIGNNHEGDYRLAEDMIGEAAKAGAGAVKFQCIVPEKLVSTSQKDRIKQLKKFQLSCNEFKKLSKIAKKENVLFLSTPFDLDMVDFLNPLVPAFKISSGDNDFLPLIFTVAVKNKPIILSTGLSDLKQISKTKEFIEDQWKYAGVKDGQLAILHCVTSYPVKPNEANLLAIKTLCDKFKGVTIGYSDHTLGIEAAALSVALGARIVEKHFTINKNHSDFHDHKISADPKEFKLLVEKIKETTPAKVSDLEKDERTRELLGNGKKCLQDGEKKIVDNVRRSITARHSLKKGTILEIEDLTGVRPGNGLSVGDTQELIGKILTKPIRQGEMILLNDVRKKG